MEPSLRTSSGVEVVFEAVGSPWASPTINFLDRSLVSVIWLLDDAGWFVVSSDLHTRTLGCFSSFFFPGDCACCCVCGGCSCFWAPADGDAFVLEEFLRG
jgi:hypothetical protein